MSSAQAWAIAATTLSVGGCASPPPPRQVPVPVADESATYPQDLAALQAALAAMAAPPAPEKPLPDVVVVMLDTFRADRLSAYGGDPLLAPRLEQLAAEARVYTQMRATSSWTLPSHASLFTALYPIAHGAHGSPPGSAAVAYGLRARGYPTLAERLSAAGYATVGIAANRAFLDSSWGLKRGFGAWLCETLPPGSEPSYVRGDRITALGLAAYARLGQQLPGTPRMLFLNYMDTHTPWFPREGFTPRPQDINPRHLPDLPEWEAAEPGRWTPIRRQVLGGDRPARSDEIASWQAAYNAEVRWLDHQIGTLLDGLTQQGLGPEDILILLSDHGEYLGEHNLLTHSKGLHEEVLAVPLLIRGPGFAPGQDPAPVQIRDVPELLLDALGLPRLAPEADDGPLQVAELYWGRHRELDDPRLIERFNRVERAFLRDGKKVIVAEEVVDFEAYDLTIDPRELRSMHDRPWAQDLRAAAQAWPALQNATPGSDVHLTEEQRRGLQALGYIE